MQTVTPGALVQVYGPRYYYPDLTDWIERNALSIRKYETKMPADTVLLHLKADPAVIRARMANAPHKTQQVQPDDVEGVQADFAKQFGDSFLKHKFEIDTTNLAPNELLSTFFHLVRPHLTNLE